MTYLKVAGRALMVTVCLTAACIESLAQAPAAGAAEPPVVAVDAVVQPGQVVAVVARDGTRTVGTVESRGGGGLVLRLADDDRRTVSQAAIGRITVKDSLKNGATIGAAIGAGVGLAVGLAFNAICANEGGACPGAVLGIVGLIAGGGAAAGALADGLHQRVVYDVVPGLPGEVTRDLLVRIGGTQQTRGSNAASAGVALTFRQRSGLGFELSADRGIGGQFRRVACVGGRPLNGQCVGPALEGDVIDLAASASLMYFFPLKRIQPYISGGIQYLKGESQEPYAVYVSNQSSQLRVYQGFDRINGGAWTTGGGARISVNRRLSVRPT